LYKCTHTELSLRDACRTHDVSDFREDVGPRKGKRGVLLTPDGAKGKTSRDVGKNIAIAEKKWTLKITKIRLKNKGVY